MRNIFTILAALAMGVMVAGMILPHPARASIDYPSLVSRPVSLTGTSAEFLAANRGRWFLMIQNICSENVGITAGATAAIGTTGTITLTPGSYISWTGKDVPRNAMAGISSGSTCPLTVLELN